jgi:hypothetical protein
MAWHAPERTCTNCGLCFGDYGNTRCPFPYGCEGPKKGVLAGWKPRTKEGIEKQRQRENLQHATSGSTGQAQEPSLKPPK